MAEIRQQNYERQEAPVVMISNPEMNYPFQTVYQPMLLRTQQTVDQRMGTAKASAHQPSRFIVT